MVSGMRIQMTSAALLLATAVALTGCSGADEVSGGLSDATDTASSAPSGGAGAAELDAEPATGSPVEGSSYSLTLPQGWAVTEPQTSGGLTTDLVASDPADVDGFPDGLNVLAPGGAVTPEQIETLSPQELASAGASDVTVEPRVIVGGSEAAHISATITTGDVDYAADQYYVSDDEQTYVVTFQFSTSVPKADRERTAESVLVTWAWN